MCCTNAFECVCSAYIHIYWEISQETFLETMSYEKRNSESYDFHFDDVHIYSFIFKIKKNMDMQTVGM